ncbi:Hypothetical predicted protein [Octopus vulgaris]|uniref:Uncharacterized protein n=1 Tax=Octopus vulgaris TaxID=6645 RepID=A0AA36EUK7_OCTVU|nr:Hypothetical predicted protein [Octopus vulgaris]
MPIARIVCKFKSTEHCECKMVGNIIHLANILYNIPFSLDIIATSVRQGFNQGLSMRNRNWIPEEFDPINLVID